jgi:hypothetical protein
MSFARRIAGSLAALLLTVLFASWLVAEPRQAGNNPKNVLARFAFRPDGEPILLPVQLEGKTHICQLDTGCTFSIYDSSLPLGEATAKEVMTTPNGPVTVWKHRPPKVMLGDLALHDKGADFVIGYDFTKVRQVSGEPIFGMIGMDFLRQPVVQIDFDAGEVRLLHTADDSCGQAFALDFTPEKLPTVKLKVPEVGDRPFLLDTGYVGLNSGDFDHELFDHVVDKKHFKVVGSTLAETAAGTDSSRLAQGKALTLGDFTVANAIVGESDWNILGLRFLARFLVTFDFPSAKLYLKKGKAFDAPDLRDLSGLHLLRIDGNTVVHSVVEKSAAAGQGIKAKDQVLKVGNLLVDKMTKHQLTRLLATPGQTVELTLRRGDAAWQAVLKLQ